MYVYQFCISLLGLKLYMFNIMNSIGVECLQVVANFNNLCILILKYRIYVNIPRIFFLEFGEEKLGCADYLKQMIPSRVKE